MVEPATTSSNEGALGHLQAVPEIYADVVVDVPTAGRADVFTYAVPDGLQVQPGHLVHVAFGNRRAFGVVVGLTDHMRAGYAKPLFGLVHPEPLLTRAHLDLAKWVSDHYHSSLFEAIAPLLPPGYRSTREERLRAPGGRRPEGLTDSAARLLTYLEQRPRGVRLSTLVRSLGPWVVNSTAMLLRKGAIERDWPDLPVPGLSGRRVSDPLAPWRDREPEPALLPTPAQKAALGVITERLNNAEQLPRVLLLHGMTGSGKTEVYLQALAHCLNQGRQGLVLVPELALTAQALARFTQRFPGQVAVLHSGLTLAQQREQWWHALRGNCGIVVGSRSAVFAPLHKLGLIVLDEEHEWTYKQQDAPPRYHAREVAIVLAKLTGATVILGSATPALESAYRARRGSYRLLTLPERVAASGAPLPLPNIQIVDMRRELREGQRGPFSRTLANALVHCVTSGQQAVLFLNRRGAGSVVQCRSCGFVMRCWESGMAYTYHADGTLVDHHTGRRRRMPAACPQCRDAGIRPLGLGTQRVVEEVQSLLPTAQVLRWDRDSARTPREHQQLLDQFGSGKAHVLVGTQMIAKGLHVPGVTLAAAVLADTGMHAPSYQAGERLFQVLYQLAGRAGRGEHRGNVLFQTFHPDHYAIQAAAFQDYDSFYQHELRHRTALRYPPLSRLIRLTFGHADQEVARNEAGRTAAYLRRQAHQWGMSGTSVVGPAPGYPTRVRGVWRWHLTLQGDDPTLLLRHAPLARGWTTDVDPVG